MSAYQEFSDIRFKDKECLLEALAALGYDQVEVGDNLPLYGYEGSARPAVSAEVVIRRRHIGHLSNDVGFARREGAYVPIVSDFDAGYRWDRETITRLKVEYGRAAVRKVVARKGAVVLDEHKQGATTTIRVRVRLP